MTTLPGFRDSSRWLWILLAVVGIAAGVAVLSYRPAKRWVSTRNARRLALEAQQALNERLWVTSSEKIKAALRFGANEPEVLRVAAKFLALNGQAKAIDYWDQLIAGGHATLEDRKDLLKLALLVGRLDVAQAELSELMRLAPIDVTTQELLLELLLATGRWSAAEASATEIIRLHPDSTTAALALGLANLKSTLPEKQSTGIAGLNRLAVGNKPNALAALRALATFVDTSPQKRSAWAEALLTHQAAQLADRLEACDVLWALNPDNRQSVVDKVASLLTAEHEESDLVAIANWMRTHGEAERADALLPQAGAAKSETLFLARLELLSTQKRWPEASALIDMVRKAHAADAIACAEATMAFSQGKPDAVATHLASALESAGTKWHRVSFIADYAWQLGQTNIAFDAWNRLFDEPRHAYSAAISLVSHLSDNSFSDHEKRAYRTLVRIQPRDSEFQAQNAYLDLLSEENIDRSLETFQRLSGAHPDSPNLSVGLAFALFRKNKMEQALSLIESLKYDWSSAEAHCRAVYSAVLAANHQLRDARIMAEGINPRQLRPLEQKLIRELVPTK